MPVGPAPRLDESDDPLIGRQLPGGHRVMEIIATGGMGRVYRAEQPMLGRTVAVKVIHPHLSGDETVEARFITEARAASQLNHPNSVNIIDFGVADGRMYLVMEFLRGRDLSIVHREEGPLPDERIARIFRQVLAALEEAHHLGIVHRDLKPENVILQSMRSGRDFVKVVDFGLAIFHQHAKERRLTFPGMVCGTPEYMAPEQARGDAGDARADIYSCGILLYELLTGSLPFEAATPGEVVAMQLNDPPPDPRKVAKHRTVTPEMVDLLARALAKQPTERFQSALEFSDAMAAALTGVADKSGRYSGQRVRCPLCRCLVGRDQKFCGQCGARLRRSSAPPFKLAPVTPSLPSIAAAPVGALTDEPAGRQDELRWLEQRRRDAEGGFACCRVVGPSGVGKTRLLAELARRLVGAGVRVVTVGPDPWRVKVGYWALRETIRGLAALPDEGGRAPSWQGASAEARAGLEAVFELGPTPPSTRAASWSDAPPLHLQRSLRREHAAEALRWALDRAETTAGDGSVALLLDDLEAFDGASRNALADVVADPGLARGWFVATHEPGLAVEWARGDELGLRGLEPGIAATLLEQSPVSLPRGTVDPGDGEAHRILPLYVDQLLRFVDEGGDEPPLGVGDLIALRIERLETDLRQTLVAIALLGDGMAPEHLSALVPEVEDVPAKLELLSEAGLIVRRDGKVWVCHPLVRHVALLGTPAQVRQELHRRAGAPSLIEALEIPLEAQAQHAVLAGDAFEALMLVEKVALRAAERGDFEGCVGALRQGLELAREEMSRGQLTDPVSAQIHFATKLGDALALRGKLVQADGVVREALDLAGPRSAARPRLLASQAHVAFLRGRHEEGFALLDQARELAREVGRRGLVVALDRLVAEWNRTTDG